MPKFIDLTGQRFGRFTVLAESGRSHGCAKFFCLCDCGSEKEVLGNDLRRGHAKSCGCLRVEKAVETMTKHGHNKKHRQTKTYMSWAAMRQRCLNPNHWKYPDYGAVGVKVCERWNSFENFLADMGERPDGKTIDRFPDPYGNYEPGNCRWATAQEQSTNQRKRNGSWKRR